MEEDYKMYILVNDDLKMGKGKIGSQIGHVVGEITERIIRNSYESSSVNQIYINYQKWKKTGHGKIILKATQQQILDLIDEPNTVVIIDEGRTQISPGSMTVLGFYPSNNLKNKFKGFKLL